MVTVVIPALNEEANLYDATVQVIGNSQNVPLEVILINDGSTDGTAEVIRKLEREFPFVRSISHKKNMGIGFSLREGIREAKHDRLAIFSGDNNVAPRLIQNLFRSYDEADVVISYPLNTECRGKMRNFISMVFTLIYTVTFDIHIRYINGNPVYPVGELRKLKLWSRSYSILAEINTKLLRSGLTFCEVEGDINAQASKSSALRLRNVIEVVSTYLRLVYEIYIKEKARFSRRAVRVARAEETARETSILPKGKTDYLPGRQNPDIPSL